MSTTEQPDLRGRSFRRAQRPRCIGGLPIQINLAHYRTADNQSSAASPATTTSPRDQASAP